VIKPNGAGEDVKARAFFSTILLREMGRKRLGNIYPSEKQRVLRDSIADDDRRPASSASSRFSCSSAKESGILDLAVEVGRGGISGVVPFDRERRRIIYGTKRGK